MKSSTHNLSGPSGMFDTDPELGMYDIRIFWLAAFVSVLAVIAVAYFKMGY